MTFPYWKKSLNNTSVLILDWSIKFDFDEAPARENYAVKVLYRGYTLDQSSKILVLFQAEDEVIAKLIADNIAELQLNGGILYTAFLSTWPDD